MIDKSKSYFRKNQRHARRMELEFKKIFNTAVGLKKNPIENAQATLSQQYWVSNFSHHLANETWVEH